MTICEYLHAWLNSTREQSPKTLERYRELADRQIMPHLGSVKLQKLRPEHIEEWHGKLLSAGLAARTVGHAHRVLSLVLKRARKRYAGSQRGGDSQSSSGRRAGNRDSVG